MKSKLRSARKLTNSFNLAITRTLRKLGREMDVKRCRQVVSGAEQNRPMPSVASLETLKSAVFEAAPEGLILFDLRGVIIEGNAAARVLFGDAATAGGRVSELLPPRVRNLFLRHLSSQTLEGRSFDRRYQTRGLNGGRQFFMEVALARISQGEAESFYIAYMRDTSDRRRAQRELNSAREKAEAAALAKSEFLANMSHEIRTPLNAIIGMADLLTETDMEADQEKYVAICRRAARSLLCIVNDMLDITRIEAGRFQLREADFDLRRCVESVCERLADRAQEKGVRFDLHIESNVPRWARGDGQRLRQLLGHIAGNAVKFTDRGCVRVDVQKVATRADGFEIGFVVTDTGIGIPPSSLDIIFEMFTQIDASFTRAYGGVGLGLAVCKRLSQAMGGSIQVASELGRGSEFRVQAPLRSALGPQRIPSRRQAELQGCRIFIVDDQPGSRLSLVQILSSLVHECVAMGGVEAEADLSERARREELPDLLLVNARLSETSAFDFLKELGTRIGTVPAAVILVPDAASVRIQSLDPSVVHAMLPLPVHRLTLLETIARVLGVPLPKCETEPSQVSARSVLIERDIRVLLVEDSEDNRALVRAYVKDSRIQLDVAENGQVAVEKVKRQPYDLVLMDMQMPVMDGYSATRTIRIWEIEAGRGRLPILALTAHALEDEVSKMLECGCDGHVSKPVRKAQLLKIIGNFAQGVQHERGNRTTADGSAGSVGLDCQA